MATGQTMDAGHDSDFPAAGAVSAPAKRGNGKLLMIVAAVVVVGGLGAAYATGMVGRLIGGGETHTEESSVPGSVDLPEIVANLNAGPRRTAFVRLKARLELASKSDEAAVVAAQPRMQDLFQTYLRDMRPEELRGSAGTYRLREELIARANIAVAPARVTEILFIELLVQ
jgi:flagellar FliL protein